ncbi:hypothetical protein B0H34DRAFT_162338 [Crassisporium funariophilum]|nr:hypothetical protein B0H34DRAFT_162338 [Crassisporium funariophilum]
MKIKTSCHLVVHPVWHCSNPIVAYRSPSRVLVPKRHSLTPYHASLTYAAPCAGSYCDFGCEVCVRCVIGVLVIEIWVIVSEMDLCEVPPVNQQGYGRHFCSISLALSLLVSLPSCAAFLPFLPFFVCQPAQGDWKKMQWQRRWHR